MSLSVVHVFLLSKVKKKLTKKWYPSLKIGMKGSSLPFSNTPATSSQVENSSADVAQEKMSDSDDS